MTAPETLEELRQAVRDVLATTVPDPDGKAQTAESALREIAALLPPAPEPIKVGDRVRWGRYPDGGDEREGVVLAGPWRERFTGADIVATSDPDAGIIELVAVGQLTRVDSSPSPEPEPPTYKRTVCPSCSEVHHRDPWWSCPSCGYDARNDDPAPSPSPEVGEGWRVPVDRAEAIAAGWSRAGVLEGRRVHDDTDEWSGNVSGHRFGEPDWVYRVPSGWAEGRERVYGETGGAS